MVRVKVQILVCMCGLSVYCEIQEAIVIEGGTWVQERQLAFRFRFGGELMFSSMLLRCSVNSLTKYSWIFTKVSSTSLSHTDGGFGAVRMALASNSSMYRLAMIGDTGEPMSAPCFVYRCYLCTINLTRLMKWPWWSCKLATLQHIWLWWGIYFTNYHVDRVQ